MIPESSSDAINFIEFIDGLFVLRAAFFRDDVFLVVDHWLLVNNFHLEVFGPLADLIVIIIRFGVNVVRYGWHRVINDLDSLFFHKFADQEAIVWHLFSVWGAHKCYIILEDTKFSHHAEGFDACFLVMEHLVEFISNSLF